MSKLMVLQEASPEIQAGILFAMLSLLEFSCKTTLSSVQHVI